MKLNKKSRGKFVGLSSFMAVFALLGTAVLCPFDGNVVEAATQSQQLRIDFVLRDALKSGRISIDFFLTESGGIDYNQIAQALGIDFYLMDYIGLSGLGDVDKGSVTPDPRGTVIDGESAFKVGTNNTNGLTVKVSGAPEMTNAVYTASKISPTTGASATTTLAMNTWGYNLVTASDTDQTSLKPVALNGDAGRSFGPGDYDLTLKFGAKVDTGVATGEYSSQVKVEVAPNATSTTLRLAVMREIDDTVEQYFQENPDERAKFEEARAKRVAENNADVAL